MIIAHRRGWASVVVMAAGTLVLALLPTSAEAVSQDVSRIESDRSRVSETREAVPIEVTVSSTSGLPFIGGWVIDEPGTVKLPGVSVGDHVASVRYLPEGLAVASDGILSGAPAEAITSRFEVDVVNGDGPVRSLAFEIGVDPSHVAYVYQAEANQTVYSVDQEGRSVAIYNGLGKKQFGQIAIAPDGRTYIVDRGKLLRLNSHGGAEALTDASAYSRLSVNEAGIVHISEPSAIVRYDPFQNSVDRIQIKPAVWASIVVDSIGNILVAEVNSSRVTRISSTGEQWSFDAGLKGPQRIVAMQATPDGRVLVSGPEGEVVSVNARGESRPIWSSGRFANDTGQIIYLPSRGLATVAGGRVRGESYLAPQPDLPSVTAIAASGTIGSFPLAESFAAATHQEERDYTTQIGGRGTFTPEGQLPPGVTLSPTGRLTVATATVRTINIPYTTSLEAGAPGRGVITIRVVSTRFDGEPPSAQMASTYDFRFTLPPNVTTSLASGSLPPGITISPDGRLSGFTGNTNGDTTFTATIRTASTFDSSLYTDRQVAIALKAQTRVVERTFTVPGFPVGVSLPAMDCPRGMRLSTQNLASGRTVPSGVRVIEYDGLWVGVSSDPEGKRENRFGTGDVPIGLNGGSATNWNTAPRTITIQLVCTTRPDGLMP